jgi:hypothetical protein
MASVTVAYHYADGDRQVVTVKVEDSYPDALDQAKGTALAAYREAIEWNLANKDDEP